MRNLAIVLLTVLLCSCQFMDDQTIISEDRNELGNPKPVDRDFKKINDQHKVLVAIIDTGVDYNHPYLTQNLHFKLDQNSSPIGYGYDISGQDTWAAPYVVRTSDYNPNLGLTEVEQSVEEVESLESLLTLAPDLSHVLNPKRNISQEVNGAAYHGTHVAGLAAYDAPEIGLLAYRAFPFSLKLKNGIPVEQDISELFLDQLIEASERAIQDGARVINMSLGQIVDKKYPTGKIFDVDTKAHLKRAERFRQLALAHPHVAFVVAAGNDGRWIDQNARVGMPCGADAPNIVCVGAVDSEGDIANFSNILLSEGTFILGYGVDVLSTMPTEMCLSDKMADLRDPAKVLALTEKQKLNLIARLRKDCADLLVDKLSGTSMATPIIAREIALIMSQNPHLTAKMAVQQMTRSSEHYNIGKISFPRLKIKKPSWNKRVTEPSGEIEIRSAFENGMKNDCDRKRDDYFEFVIPQSYNR